MIPAMRPGPMFAVIAIAAAAGLAVAQTAAPRHKLHEDLPSPSDQPTRMIGGTGSGNPAAFTAGDKVLPRPTVDRPAGHPTDEPVLGNGGFAADRRTTMTPDGNTGPDATLHYVSVFNPDVLPFKRMSALDGVADDYTLQIAHTALVELPVGGATDKTRDPFWGSVLLHLQPGQDVPLPSVAPDMRILSYEITPKIAIKFEKDGADNFYVRSDESSAAGTYRLVFAADADAGYFAPSLPTTGRYTPLMVAAMAPPELRPVLPDRIRHTASRMLTRLDVDREMDLGVVFNKLVGYFRAFQAKPMRTGTDIYLDLCFSQAGVCRHRAFAFMITANALGIPTRFVENEAHAFVEVWFPDRRWQRIDLGGAALRMEVTGASDKVLHRPRADDPFEKPPEYKQNYTQLEGDIKGLTRQQLADKHRSLSQAPPSGAFDPGPGSGSGLGSVPDRILPDQSLPAVTRDPKKPSPSLTVTYVDDHAFRGAELHVEGVATAAGKPIPDHTVAVYLSPAGRNGADSILLGQTVTEADGSFHAYFPVPPSIALKAYEIWLSSTADAYYNAALSEP
jgi:hypothetical protein